MSKGRHFSEEELDFIKVNALVLSIDDISKALERNYWSVHRKMKEMGIMRNHKFTPEEDFMIRMMYSKYSAKVIATRLGVDENAIYNRVKKLGLKKNRR